MAARAPDIEVRRRLLEATARLISEEGTAALSTRRLAAEVGASTMAVYTHFGGLPDLIRAVVAEGFARLAAHLSEVPVTDDPVQDLLNLGFAYRANALDNPQLYSVMFGSASLGGYRLSGDELDEGRYTFEVLMAATTRVIDSGAFVAANAEHVAAQLWSALHGYVSLELAGYFARQPGAVDEVLLPLLINLGIGLSGDPKPDPKPDPAPKRKRRARN